MTAVPSQPSARAADGFAVAGGSQRAAARLPSPRRVRAEMTRRGLTISAAAAEMGVSQTALWLYLSERSPRYVTDGRLRIAAWLARPGPALVLTPGMTEILVLMADGLTDHAIAGRLRLSEQYVSNRTTEVYARLAALNRAHAVAIAMRAGLIS